MNTEPDSQDTKTCPMCAETILAHDDSAFRVAVVPSVSSNEYQSFKLSVSTARNTRSLF
jgi:hypothetical protein